MNNPTSEKLQKLFAMLERSPNDTFLLYGIGMEYKKLDQLALAIEYYNKTLAIDPGYCYAYYQRGQVQEQNNNVDSAKRSYVDGIAAAERTGDSHAKSELQSALQMLE